MNELIGLKGVLEGIREMLVVNEKDTIELLKTRMECSKSMLDGVIKEMTPPVIPVTTTGNPEITETHLDPQASQAKSELT